MQDSNTTIQELKNIVAAFIDEREWSQFHSPKNLSMLIAIEAAELMEKFQWCDTAQSYRDAKINKDEVEQELADVIIAALCLSRAANIDIAGALERKMQINACNYPVSKAKGVCTKYDKL